jgi:TnsA endonuclease N terminal
MPVRRVPRNYRSVTAKLASKKNGRIVHCESTLERDFFLRQEFDQRVVSYEEQPVRVDFMREGKKTQYVPDARVEYVSRTPVLCEIKYRSELREKWRELRPALKAGRRLAKARGEQFKIITEREIRTPFLKNARQLLPFRSQEYDHGIAASLLLSVRERPRAFGELLEGLSIQESLASLRVIWCLLARGLLIADLELLIDESTMLSVDANG